jgi:pullulanase
VPLPSDLLDRKQTDFVLWHPKPAAAPPVLVIGEFQFGNPPSLINVKRFPLAPVAGFTDLFSTDGVIYHYFFEPADGLQTTDPAASTVDWRLLSTRPDPPFTTDDRQPAAVVKFQGGRLVPCDPGGSRGFHRRSEPIQWPRQ